MPVHNKSTTIFHSVDFIDHLDHELLSVCFMSTSLKCMLISADVMLDLEPWLNETTACTFPEPFFSEAKFQQNQTPTSKLQQNQAPTSKLKLLKVLPKVLEDRLDMINLTQYEGTFGNFAYGNITASYTTDNNGKLHY